LRGDEDLRQLGGEKFGKVESISLDDRTIDIKKRQDTAYGADMCAAERKLEA
jgi:uncharacterized protein